MHTTLVPQVCAVRRPGRPGQSAADRATHGQCGWALSCMSERLGDDAVRPVQPDTTDM